MKNDLANYKCNEQRTMTDKLQIYKEDGKVIISKKSKFLGVVYLDEREVREVASRLYKLIVKNNGTD